jgi:endonuclease/exonuclease/phosphatase family metal-dependent hydrolase
MRRLGIVSIILFVATAAISAPGEQSAGLVEDRLDLDVDARRTIDQRLRVLSYNVFLRPAPVNWRDHNTCRARQIGQMLTEETVARDIVVLNETFDVTATEELAQRASQRFPHQVLVQPGARGLRISGGLSILSRHPIEQWRSQRFDRCSGKFNDCLANKGFVWALIRVSEHLKVNVVATHMNSGRDSGARKARRAQLEQIRDFVDSTHHSARWPTLFVGDLNVDGLRWEPYDSDDGQLTEYAQAKSLLGDTCIACQTTSCFASCDPYPIDTFRQQNGPWSDDAEGTASANTHNCLRETLEPCRSPNADELWRRRSRFDYIFHFGPPPLRDDLEINVLQAASRPFDGKACGTDYLSDHKGVEATLEFRRNSDLNVEMSSPSDAFDQTAQAH